MEEWGVLLPTSLSIHLEVGLYLPSSFIENITVFSILQKLH